MSAAGKKRETRTATLPSGTCAAVAKGFEKELEVQQATTAVIPSTVLLSLRAEMARNGSADSTPRFEVVELDPDDLIIEFDNSPLEEAPDARHSDLEQAFAALTRG